MSDFNARRGQEEVVPVLAEELVIDKREVQTGGIRVNRRVVEHDEAVEIPLLKEHVDVRRVVINREVDGPLAVRQEGDVTIIPIVEEELVVSKRYRLKEEIHVIRQVRQETHVEHVAVRHQEAEVEQLDSSGQAHTLQPSEVKRAPRKRILGDR
jgi:uncharacterized protein (TIGR02271 family)